MTTNLAEALRDATAHLAATISLLEGGGKKAAPSDKMFEIMLEDYRKSLDRARSALAAYQPAPEREQGHSKLVYNKTTRTIDKVDPHPVPTRDEVIEECAKVAEDEIPVDDGDPGIIIGERIVIAIRALKSSPQGEK